MSQAQWPDLGRLRQGDFTFEASLGYMTSYRVELQSEVRP